MMLHHRKTLLPLLLSATLLAGLLVPASASAGDKRFALVIGYNHSDDPKLKPLRYADDDALRYAELFGTMADVTLLTELDKDTRRLAGTRGNIATAAPTRQGVIDALGALRTKMRAAKQQGHRPVLYFVYSGHGNYDAEGRGYVHLKSGRFTTRDLYSHLFAPSGGDPVVLMVDACNAALLVNSRGAGTRRKARQSRMNLEQYPNVGVVLSSSSVGEVHEWGRYLAGVFSHEVRSALVGPADLDGDDKVTFAEVAAFIAAANDKVKNPTIRISAYIRPPLNAPNLALVDLKQARFHARVRIDKSIAGKAHVVDGDLVRYADFHKTGAQSFWLGLVRPGPYTVVQGSKEHRLPAEARGDVTLADYPAVQRTAVRSRGTHSDYFDRTLFHQPYGTSFAANYLKSDWLDSLTVERDIEQPWYENGPAWATLGAGLISLGVAGGFTAQAFSVSREAANTPWGDKRVQLNQEISRHETTAGVLYGIGGAAVVGSILWFILDRPVSTQRYKPPLSVGVSPGGVVLSTKY